jgi:flagellar protein FlaJ
MGLAPSPEHAPPRVWDRHRRGYEVAVLAALAGGALMAVAGGAAASLEGIALQTLGLRVAVGGIALLLLACLLGRPLLTYRSLYRASRGNTRYEQLRHWTRLKTASILLNLLTAAACVALLASLAVRVDPLVLNAPFPLVLRFTVLFAVILAVIQALVHHLALRTPMQRPDATHGLEGLLLYLAVGSTAAFALLAAVLGDQPLNVAGLVHLRSTDAPFFLLAAAAAGSITLFIARSLPTVYALLSEERTYYTGHTYMSKSKSVLLPAMMAFALLFLLVLVLLVFGLGLASFVEEIPRNSVLIGVFGFIGIAMVASVAATLMLQRREDRAMLYQKTRSPEQRRSLLILGASVGVALALFGLALLLLAGRGVLGLAPRAWTDVLAFALMAALGPYGFYAAARYNRIRKLEERFPDFLRDLAASRKAGLTLHEAVSIASRGEYGALTPEIVKMADQLSWNVPFHEALARFGERVRTPLVQRAVSLINEASRTGGHVTDVLLAAARDAREIKNLETERRTTMGLYTMIIYIVFFVFLSVAAVLYGTFVPQILKTASAAGSGGTLAFAGMKIGEVKLEDYRVFYFMAALMQGLGNGFVGGLMGTGKPLDGLRHAFAMVLITWVVFALVLAPS